MKSIFNDISYKQIKTLLSIIYNANDKTLERLQILYRQKGLRFEQTLKFAKGMKLIDVRNGKVKNTKLIETLIKEDSLKDEQLKPLLVNLMLNSENIFKKEIKGYLDNFKFYKTGYKYNPPTNERIKYRGIRNFLLELGLITYHLNSRIYTLAPNYTTSFVEGKKDTVVSPEQLKVVLRKKDELGKAAEKAVLDYEKDRLSDYPELVEEIEYIAQKNVMAGYDIKSFERKVGEKMIKQERFIEVKTVTNNNISFYWTRNEIEKAKLYGPKYFLYLMPVFVDRKFDIKGLTIIPNAYKEVFVNKNWERQTENYLFTKK